MGQFQRVGETGRAAVSIFVDGEEVTAVEGDTVLTALLSARRHVRASEVFKTKRAGLCLMAACQDCWIWRDDGERIRACSTLVSGGMALSTVTPFSS